MKIYLTDEQIDQVIKELDETKNKLEETLARGFIILSVDY